MRGLNRAWVMEDGVRREMLALLPRLRRFAYGLSGGWDEADDLVQATYEKAIGALDSWTPGTRLDAWMYRIMRNHFFNERRASAAKLSRAADLDLVQRAAVDGERFGNDRITLSRVFAALQGLPEDQRTALLLVSVEGFSYGEVASLMDEPVGTIASRVGRARQALRPLIGAQRDPGDEDGSEDKTHEVKS